MIYYEYETVPSSWAIGLWIWNHSGYAMRNAIKLSMIMIIIKDNRGQGTTLIWGWQHI